MNSPDESIPPSVSVKTLPLTGWVSMSEDCTPQAKIDFFTQTKLEFFEYANDAFARARRAIHTQLMYVYAYNSPIVFSDVQRIKDFIQQGSMSVQKRIEMYKSHTYGFEREQISELIDLAWNAYSITESDAEQLFSHSSVGMHFFHRTFQELDKISVIDSITHEAKLQVLEIAGEERDAASQKLSPKLLRSKYLCIKEMRDLACQANRTEIFWAVKGRPLYSVCSSDESQVYHESLGLGRERNEVRSPTAKLGKIAFKLALVRAQTQDIVGQILERFLQEEAELVHHLGTWYGAKGMYRRADFEEFNIASPKFLTK